MIQLKEETLACLFDQCTREYSDLTALSFTDEPPITYAEFRKRVEYISQFLRNQGVVPGDRVAIIGENSPQWGVAYFAITTMGAVVVPILPDFHFSDVHHILRHSGSKVIFISERFYQKVEELNLAEFNSVILLNDFSVIKPDTTKATLRQLMADGSKELQKIRNLVLELTGRIQHKVREDDIAAFIYTSGTTGHSKGVMLTHRNIVWNAIWSSQIPNIRKGDRMLSILPLAHVYECTLGLVIPILCGAAVYYVKRPPTPTILMPALAQVKPTAMLTVPLIIEKIYKTRILPEIRKNHFVRLVYAFPAVRKRINKVAGKSLKETFGGCMRFFGVGGSALSAEVERFLIEAEFPYAIGYGLTETSPLIAGSNAEHTRFRSTGPKVIGLDVRIDNPDPKTGIGEIIVHGPSVMKGYYRDKERTAEVLSADGWFRTGDLGMFDKDNYLYIKGRMKNVILGPSGENIYPEVIESIIDRSDEVLESLVFEEEGQLCARIYLDYEKLDAECSALGLTGMEVSARIKHILDTVLKQTNEQVSAFSRLARVYEQREPFEKTPTQKIKRYLYAKTGK
jgi:long-chain acyl-CoA synthetase